MTTPQLLQQGAPERAIAIYGRANCKGIKMLWHFGPRVMLENSLKPTSS